MRGTAQAQGVRPEVGKPLQQAGDLLKAGKAKEALAKVREADAASGKTPAEQLMIDRMKGAAAQRAGDNATAIQAFESLFDSGKLSGAEQAQMAEQLAFAYSQQKDWPQAPTEWVSKAQAAGSNERAVEATASLCASAERRLRADRQGRAGRGRRRRTGRPQARRRRPAAPGRRPAAHGQHRRYVATLDKLLAYYPKKEYWSTCSASCRARPASPTAFRST